MSESDNKLYLLLGEIRGDIKSLIQSNQDQSQRLDQHSARLTTLERFQWKLMGGATAVSIVVGYAIKIL